MAYFSEVLVFARPKSHKEYDGQYLEFFLRFMVEVAKFSVKGSSSSGIFS